MRTDNLGRDYSNEKDHHVTNQLLTHIRSVASPPKDKIILFSVVISIGKDERQGVKVI